MELRELAFEWIIVVEKGKNECQLLKTGGTKSKFSPIGVFSLNICCALR